MTLMNGTTDAPIEPLVELVPDDAGGNGDDGNHNGLTNGALSNPMPGNIRPADIVGEMQTAYLDYAMSVIVARALPDVRDGLKPVHRRILYAMSHDLYLTHTKPHRKSARIVGEVLGKYHPHGDVAVYDAMVRMAQEFSLRYPLVDGQGNFGSVDGDGAAAMRYTEARLAEIAELMLADLDKDTVEWHDNFDNSLEEPDVLPAALPNLLINGSSGIAVGMATNVPPHNLGEIVDALVYLIDRYQAIEEITVDELLQFVKGPDFPTGGILYRFREDKADENIDVIAQGYAMGKARLIMQAKAHFEEMSRGRSRIVVTELPYQTNKTALIERIASLARDAKIEGITDLRDESDRTGMRIVIELTRNADAKDVLKDLFKYTPLQQTFGMQMLALVDGQPRLLSLKRALHLFVQHREEIIRRRSEYDLAKARDRAHIVEGLLKALDILDEVIATIRRSQTVETARNNLVKNFAFSEIQAQAILDMQLRRLAALERKKLKDEYDELLARIAYLEDLLAHPEKILAVIREDLLAQKEKYGDARRTQIVDRTKGTLTTTDLLPQQEVWVTVSADGELRRQDVTRPTVSTMRQMAKHGQVAMLTANTRDWLYLFCRDGRCTRVAIHEIPQNGSPKHVAELSDFTRRDAITAAISIPRISASEASGYLFLATMLGDVKRVAVADLISTIANEFPVIAVTEKDRLGWVLPTQGKQDVMLITAEGQSIRFNEEDVRSMGLAAGGVGGIKLKKKDIVVHADLIDPSGEGTVLTMTEQGYAKRSELAEYSRQGRNGGGIVTHKPTSRTGLVATALLLGATTGEEELVAIVTAKHQVLPLPVAEIPVMGRGVQGKSVVELAKGDQVSVIKRISDSTAPTTLNPSSGNGNSSVDLPTGDNRRDGQGPSVSAGGTTSQVSARAKPTKQTLTDKTTVAGKSGQALSKNAPAATSGAVTARTRRAPAAIKRTPAPKPANASLQASLIDVTVDAPTRRGNSAAEVAPHSAKKAATARSNQPTAPIAAEALRLNLVESTDPPHTTARRASSVARENGSNPASSASPKIGATTDSATASKGKQKAKGPATEKVVAVTPPAPPATSSVDAKPSPRVPKARKGLRVNEATVAASPALQSQPAKGATKRQAPVAVQDPVTAQRSAAPSARAARGNPKGDIALGQASIAAERGRTRKSATSPSATTKRAAAEEQRPPQPTGKVVAPSVDTTVAATGEQRTKTAQGSSGKRGRKSSTEKLARATSPVDTMRDVANRRGRNVTSASAPVVKKTVVEKTVAEKTVEAKGVVEKRNISSAKASSRAKSTTSAGSPSTSTTKVAGASAKTSKKKLRVATSVNSRKKDA